MANSRFNDDLNAAKRGVARWAKDPLGIDLIHDAYHKIVNDHWADKHVDNPKPAAKAPDYYSDPNITSRPASTPNPPKPAAPKPTAPKSGMQKWTNEELAAGAARQGDIQEIKSRVDDPTTLFSDTGLKEAYRVRGQVAADSTNLINSEVERRSKKLKAEADRNRNR